MTLIRVIREQAGTPGCVREVTPSEARELIERGDAVRVIVRENTDIERG